MTRLRPNLVVAVSLCSLSASALKPFQEEARIELEKGMPETLKSLNESCGTQISTIETDFEKMKEADAPPPGYTRMACLQMIEGIESTCRRDPVYKKVIAKKLTGIACLWAGAVNDCEKGNLFDGASRCGLRNLSFSDGTLTYRENKQTSNGSETVRHFLRDVLNRPENLLRDEAGLTPFQQEAKARFEEREVPDALKGLNEQCGTHLTSIKTDFENLKQSEEAPSMSCATILGDIQWVCGQNPAYKKAVAAKLTGVACLFAGAVNQVTDQKKRAIPLDGASECGLRNMSLADGVFTFHENSCLTNSNLTVLYFLKDVLNRPENLSAGELKPFQEEAKNRFEEHMSDATRKLNLRCGTELSPASLDFENLSSEDDPLTGQCLSFVRAVMIACDKPKFKARFVPAVKTLACVHGGGKDGKGKDALKPGGASSKTLQKLKLTKGVFSLSAGELNNLQQSVVYFMEKSAR